MPDINAIRKICELQPNEPFPRYGLAMELKKQGLLEDSRVVFDELERRFPDYIAQYLMHVNLLVEMKRKADAQAVGERGLAVARRKGDGHALGEIQRAVDDLEFVED